MTALAYFADLPNGSTIEFKTMRVPTFVDRMGCQRYRVAEPKVQRCLPTDGTADALTGNVLCGYVEGRGWARITRTVEMKSSPSRHECDARCMNASGRAMNCECACGGANHGKGRFMCEAA